MTTGDNGVIRGHTQVVDHVSALIRGLTPPGVQVELPPPAAKAFDIVFDEYVPGRSLTAAVTVSGEYLNAAGVLQGGFLAAIFDNLIGPLSYLVAGGPATTLELSTHFLRPALPGDRLTLQAVVRKAGRAAIYIAAEAHNGDGKLVATAMSTIQVLPIPQAASGSPSPPANIT